MEKMIVGYEMMMLVFGHKRNKVFFLKYNIIYKINFEGHL